MQGLYLRAKIFQGFFDVRKKINQIVLSHNRTVFILHIFSMAYIHISRDENIHPTCLESYSKYSSLCPTQISKRKTEGLILTCRNRIVSYETKLYIFVGHKQFISIISTLSSREISFAVILSPFYLFKTFF